MNTIFEQISEFLEDNGIECEYCTDRVPGYLNVDNAKHKTERIQFWLHGTCGVCMWVGRDMHPWYEEAILSPYVWVFKKTQDSEVRLKFADVDALKVFLKKTLEII